MDHHRGKFIMKIVDNRKYAYYQIYAYLLSNASTLIKCRSILLIEFSLIV